MKRGNWLIILLIIIIVTFGIVFILSRGSGTNAGPDSGDVNQNMASSQSNGEDAVPDNLSSSDVTGAVHFGDCAFRTGGNAIIGIPNDVTQNIGISLEPGDEISVITPDGELCTGAGVWTGENMAITAWGDKNDTEEVEGLRDGEEIRFRIWDMSTGEEIDISAVTYIQGDGFFAIDGIYIVQSLSVNP